jgi:hypothetical protein
MSSLRIAGPSWSDCADGDPVRDAPARIVVLASQPTPPSARVVDGHDRRGARVTTTLFAALNSYRRSFRTVQPGAKERPGPDWGRVRGPSMWASAMHFAARSFLSCSALTDCKSRLAKDAGTNRAGGTYLCYYAQRCLVAAFLLA